MSGTRRVEVANQRMPSRNSAFPFVIEFDASGDALLDLTVQNSNGFIDQIQGVFIDNSANSYPLTLECGISGMPLKCPGASQGWFPVLVPNPPIFNISGQPSGRAKLFFTNMPMPVGVWQASPAPLTWTRNTFNDSFAAHPWLPANPNRKGLIIGVNLDGSTAAFVDLTGDAGGVTGNMILVGSGVGIPDTLTLIGDACPTNAIDGVAGINNTVTIYEGT